MKLNLAAAPAAVLSAVVLGACGSDDGGSAGAPASGGSESKATIVEPQDGAEVGQTFTAKVSLSGFEIDKANVGKANKPGGGHLHFSLDGGEFDRPQHSGPNGELAVKLGVDGKYSPAVAPEITYKDIPPGEHTLKVQLVNNDHSETGMEAETTFKVGAGQQDSPEAGGSSGY